jgi:DNA-binding LytR/AlgR family response regulator
MEVLDKVNSQNRLNINTLMVQMNRKKCFILKEDINFIEVQGKISIINAESGQWTTNKTLKELGKQLNSNFIRVHRAFIVNKKQIISITQISDRVYEIELRNCSQKIPMSRNAYSKHKQMFK